MRLDPGDKVLDFYTTFVPVDMLQANGIRSIAGYLKNYRADYVAAVHAAGIGFTPIYESGQSTALGGATAGHASATVAIAQARRGGIPPGVVIIFTHDSGAWSTNIPAYFTAAEHDVRAAGYGFGGYVSKQVADACRAIGVVFDISWAPAAYSWGGGRDDLAHIWQKPSSVFPGLPGRVDFGTVKRQVDVWCAGETIVAPPVPPIIYPPVEPILEEDDMKYFATNSQQRDDGPAGAVKWILEAGRLRHLGEPEWKVYGSPAGVPLSNTELAALGA